MSDPVPTVNNVLCPTDEKPPSMILTTTMVDTFVGILYQVLDDRPDAPFDERWSFTIPGGHLPGVREVFTLRLTHYAPPPNWWWRMWSWLLLGWRWKREETTPASTEATQ